MVDANTLHRVIDLLTTGAEPSVKWTPDKNLEDFAVEASVHQREAMQEAVRLLREAAPFYFGKIEAGR